MREFGKQREHAILEQFTGRDAFDQQPVHRRAQFARLPQTRGGQKAVLLRVAGIVRLQQARQFEPAAGRIGGWRNGRARLTDRIEQRAERFVEIEIADHRHARQQQPAPGSPDERLGYGARGAAARQQEGELGQTEAGVAIARDQPGDQRIGKSAMRGDRVYLRAASAHFPRPRPRPCSHICISVPPARLRWGRSLRACRLRTIRRCGRGRRAAPPRSRVPTGHWSKTCPRAHRGAGGAKRAGCR